MKQSVPSAEPNDGQQISGRTHALANWWPVGSHLKARNRCRVRQIALSSLLFFLAYDSRADQKEFVIDGTTFSLQEVTSEVGVYYQFMRFNRATGTWNVDVYLASQSTRVFHGPFVLSIESYSGTTGPLQPDGFDNSTPAKAFYDLSFIVNNGTLAPGERTAARTLSIGFANGVPSLTSKVYMQPALPSELLALTRSLNEAGQPLPGVQVVETGPQGNRTNVTDATFGVITLGQAPGGYVWQFSAPGYLPVWVQQTLTSNGVTELPAPRLVRRARNTFNLTPIGGGLVTNADTSVQINFSPASFTQNATATLTPLTGQTLPALLPQGWSPLQAFWLELTAEPAQPGSATLIPWGAIDLNETAVLARFDATKLQWIAFQTLPGNRTNALIIALPGSGAYCLVIGDSPPQAPPVQQIGRALAPSTARAPDFTLLKASGTVEPASSPASLVPDLVTATANVAITNQSGTLSSGTLLRCQVKEEYRLRDGTRRVTPQYENFIVAYTRPGDRNPSTLHASFPMRPLLLLGPEELDRATISVDVLAPAPFAGGILDSSGGEIASGNMRILAGSGDITGIQAIELHLLNPTNFIDLAASNYTILQAFDLSLAGLTPGHHLTAQFDSLPTNALFVLAKVLTQSGMYGLQPIERLASDATGKLRTLEPATGDRLPGLVGTGEYVLVQTPQPLALVSGTAQASNGQTTGGLPVRITAQPWLAVSASDGTFRLLAAVGKAQLVVTDPQTGDTGQTTVSVSDPQVGVTATLSALSAGPSVVSVTPAPGATAVSRVTSIVVQFSKALNPGSLGTAGIQLLGTNGQPVAASLTLDLANTLATLLPIAQLDPSTAYTLVLSTNLADATGRFLEGTNAFGFTTARDSLNRGLGAQVISYEPTNGFARMEGTQGIADPGAPVILVNETSGRTTTVLSNPDGSFRGTLEAAVDDVLSVVFVNQNGTRNTVPVSRQVFSDGSVGLFQGGGILEAQSDNGPIQLIVEPGTVPAKSKFGLQPLKLAEVLAVLSNTPPQIGTILGGFRYSRAGGDLTKTPEISFPVNVANLGLPPGIDPTNASYALTIPRTNDGVVAYEIVDRMTFDSGKLVTHWFPFLGLQDELNVLVAPLLLSVGRSVTVAGKVSTAQINFNGNMVTNTQQFLPGAFVTASAQTDSPSRPGRLESGTVYATSRSDATYSLLVPANAANGVVVRATHPRFPRFAAYQFVTIPTGLERLAVANTLAPVDLVFGVSVGPLGDLVPPALLPDQTPLHPQPGQTVILHVLATDNASRPSISFLFGSVVSLSPGVQATTDDINWQLQTQEDIGTFGRRNTYSFSTAKALQFVLNLSAQDDAGNITSESYPILFGGAQPVDTNTIPPADPNERTGPMVIATIPSDGATAFPYDEPILVTFDKPIARSVLHDPSSIQIFPPASSPTLSLSPDQTVLTLRFYDLKPGTAYTLTLGPGLHDLSGNALDEDPSSTGNNPFTMNFRTAPLVTGVLPGLQSGGGAVIKGIYAYVLERQGPLNGAVNVYDLSNPTNPVSVAQFSVPGYPRDLALISNYSFKRSPDSKVETNDLLAVVGGNLNNGVGQYLWIIDISNPLSPQRVAAAQIDVSPSAAVTKILWAPPRLGFLDIGNAPSIGIINLQSFILGELLRQLAPGTGLPWSPQGSPGLDLNGDGDYVDPGEQLPLPPIHAGQLAGLEFSFALNDTDQFINDFAMGHGGNFIGILVDSGHLLGPDGLPTITNTPPAYRTLYDPPLTLDRETASFPFTNGLPSRLSMLFQFPLVVSNQVSVRDLALVSVNGQNGTTNRLVVLDVTDPTAPHELTEVPLPPQNGSAVFSVKQRDDGLLMVALNRDILLIDPSGFGTPVTSNSASSALLGIIPGAGVGAKSFGTVPAGLTVTSLGPLNQVFQTAPSLKIVSFPTIPPFAPASVGATNDAGVRALLGASVEPEFLQPSRFRPEPPVVDSALSPPQAASHYYVLVAAPGSAGPTIDLALESLNWAGHPLTKKGFLFPPVHALGSKALAGLGQTPLDDEPVARSSTAWRLSPNPASMYYNVYLSRPFALVYEEMSKDDLASVQTELDRDILWSGALLRVSLDPAMTNNTVLAPFASVVSASERILLPGVETILPAFPADYLQSPNPGPVAGGLMLATALNAIAAHNGEMIINALDLQLPGRRLPLEFRRNYSGQGLFDGPFGRGWDFNYNQRLLEMKESLFPPGAQLPLAVRETPGDTESGLGGDLLFYTGAGRVMVYKFAGTNAPPEVSSDPLVQELGWIGKADRFYLPPTGAFNLFFKFLDGSYARLETDGTQYWYNAAGHLVKVYDRYDQNALEMGYNRHGELIRITDEIGRAVDIGYWRLPDDPLRRPSLDQTTTNSVIAGRICSLLDYSQRDVQFYYTDDGLLDRREGPDVETALATSFHGRQVTRYNYSDTSAPTQSGKSITGIVGGDDSGSSLISATALGQRGRDTVNTLRVGNANLRVTQNFTNTAYALSHGNGLTAISSPDGSSVTHLLDNLGRATQTIYLGTNGPALTNRSEYYTNGLLKLVTAPEGNSTEFIYDSLNPSLRARGNQVRVLKHPGPRGGPELEASTEYDNWYNLAAGGKTDFNGNAATISLTLDHRDTASVSVGGETETFTINAFGQIETFTSYDGIEHRWTYNLDGFPIATATGPLTTTYLYTPSGSGVSDPSLRGLPSAVIDPNGIETDFLYDEQSRVVRTSRAATVTTRAYDSHGNMVESVTQVETNRALVTDLAYNQFGLLTNQVVKNVETAGLTNDLVTTFIPDDFNRTKEVIYPGGDQHFLEYDHAGRITRYTVNGVYTETYAYDGNGNQIARSNGAGTEWFYRDGHDRLNKMISANGTEIDFDQDGNGNLLGKRIRNSAGDILSQVTNTVDALNRFTSVTVLRDQGSSTLTYGYDSAHRTILITDALGAVSTNVYDAAGRLSQMARPTATQTFTYDGNDNLVQKASLENGVNYSESYGYDVLNHLTNITDNLGNAALRAVELDGRVVARTDKEHHTAKTQYSILGEPVAITSAAAVTTRYAYNANRQVTSISDPDGDVASKIYDSPGRLLQSLLPDGAVTLYTNFDALTRPELTTLPRAISTFTLFDPEGNLTNRLIQSPGSVRAESYQYDALQRPIRISDPNSTVAYQYDHFGFTKQADFQYRFLTNPPLVANLSVSLRQDADLGGFRSLLIYPDSSITVTNRRDASGRLLALVPSAGEPIIQESSYAGDDFLGSRTFGRNRITLTALYDPLKRPVVRRYSRNLDGGVLCETRYAYDRDGAQVARQSIHRAGRIDFFSYDSGYRLIRADLACRPNLGMSEPARSYPGFQLPAQVSGAWAPGLFSRVITYNGADVLQGISTVNPDNLSIPPMSSVYSSPDTLLFVPRIDGFALARDEAGNVTRGQLAVRLPGNPTPVLVGSTMTYNELGQMTRIDRDDGVVILTEYDALGLRMRRKVTGDPARCVPSDIAFVYESGKLIEERDLNNGGVAIARYYYGDDGDELLAGDLPANGSATLARFYFLTDTLKSVLAVADATGQVVERANYDAWGFPARQSTDTNAPRVSRIWAETNTLLIQFSEAVLPAFAQGNSSSNLLDFLRDPGTFFQLQAGTQAISGAAIYEENHPGALFGSVFRFQPSQPINGQVQLTVNPGVVQDEWNNTNAQEIINLDLTGTNALFSGPPPGSTAPVEISRSLVGSLFLFHGQIYDDDTGLLYCRARYYSPLLGTFLQRDPAAYKDSVNQYAGFANDPVNRRDPSGSATDEFGGTLKEFGTYLNENSGLLKWTGVGTALEFAGSTLQLGTATAEGWDLMHSDRQGSFGLLDRIHGAQLMAKDAQTAAAAGGIFYVVGNAMVGKIQGYLTALSQKRALQQDKARAIRALNTTAGLQEFEAAALLEAQDETGITVHARYNSAKAQARPQAVEKGLLQKTVDLSAYKSKANAIGEGYLVVPHPSFADAHGVVELTIKKVNFVSDIDLFLLEKNGRLATAVESAEFRALWNRNVRALAKLHGKRIDVPIKHPAALELAYSTFGNKSEGKLVNQDFLIAVGHPGEVVTIRPWQSGGYVVQAASEAYVQQLIERAEPLLEELQRRAKVAPVGFPDNWKRSPP